MREELQQAFEHGAGGVRSIAVLLPCHNEEATIAQVIDFRRALPSADIYVYDNNPTDRTAEMAKAAGALVRFEPYQGKGNVVRRMFADIDADIYVLADGDLTYDASAAGRLDRAQCRYGGGRACQHGRSRLPSRPPRRQPLLQPAGRAPVRPVTSLRSSACTIGAALVWIMVGRLPYRAEAGPTYMLAWLALRRP